MIEITCGCKDNSAQPVGVGVINARPSLKMNVRDVKVKSKHQLRSPIKEFYKKCLPLLSIDTANGLGPIYDVCIDPIDIEICSPYNGYGYGYSYERCEDEPGQLKEEILDYLVNRGSAEIEYRLAIDPNYLDGQIGDELLIASPDLIKQDNVKDFELAYKIANFGVGVAGRTPKLLDARFSKDGNVYAFAYFNELGNGEFGVNSEGFDDCDAYKSRYPDWRIGQDENFEDQPENPQVYVAIYKKGDDDQWNLSAKIATGFIDFSTEGTNILFGGLALNADGTVISVSNQEEDSIYPNNGRVKIWTFNEIDRNYVRTDQVGYDPLTKKVENPSSYDRNYTQNDFRCPENFIVERNDNEVVVIGTTLYSYDEFYEEALEKIEGYSQLFCTSTERFTFGSDALVDGEVPFLYNGYSKNARVSDAFCGLVEDNTLVTWGDPDIGGKITTLNNILENVQDVSACEFGFSALKSDGTVFTWGGVKQESDRNVSNLANVTKIFANSNSFVALRGDGRAFPYSDIGRITGGVSGIYNANGELLTTLTPNKGYVDLRNIKDVSATKKAFAAIKTNGRVVAWGQKEYGADSNYNRFGLIDNVKKIYGRHNYFAAINNDGSVSTWGNIEQQAEDGNDITLFPWYEAGKTGLNIDPSQPTRNEDAPDSFFSSFDSSVASELSLTSQQLPSRDKKKYIDIISNPYASVALREDGFITAWGDSMHGGRPIKDVNRIEEDGISVSIQLSFAGNTITDVNGGGLGGFLAGQSIRIQSSNEYGDGDYTIVEGNSDSLVVTNLDGSTPSFETRTNSNVARVVRITVVNVGGKAKENDYISFTSKNDFRDIKSVISNYYSFAALKTNNTVLTWGRKGFGGDSPNFYLADGETISSIYSSVFAYAALTSEGKVKAWGKKEFGGDVTFNVASSDGDTSLEDPENKVTSIHSGRVGFIATREDKSVVVWGDKSLSYGIKIVGPEAVGIFGRREDYGLGYSIDLDYDGESIVIGNKKKSFLNNAFPGSVKVFQRGQLSSKWKRIGNTIRNTLFRNDGRIGFGRNVKINYDGSKIVAHRLAKKLVPVSPGSNETKQDIVDSVAIYSFVDNNWQTQDSIFFPEGHDRSIPFVSNDDWALKVNNFISIDASGSTLALGTPASGSIYGNTSNGEVNIYTLGSDGNYFLDATLKNSPLISGDNQKQTSGVFDDWTASTLFGENLSLSANGKNILISRRDGAVVYNKENTGYGEENWQEKTRIHQYDNPKYPTYFHADQIFTTQTRIMSAHMSSGGEYVSTTFLGANTTDQNHYAHNIYTINSKDDRQDYDFLNTSYLSHFSSTIQESGEYSQYLFTNDGSLFDGQTSKDYGKFQSIALGEKGDLEKMSFTFWSDVNKRSSSRILKWGRLSINMTVNSIQSDTKRDVIVSFVDSTSLFTKSFKKFTVPIAEYNDLFHFSVLYDKDSKYVSLYVAGELHQKISANNIPDFSLADPIHSSIGGFSKTDHQKQILDDVRVFSRILTRNEIFKLANHRKIARRTDTYAYDINSAKGNCFEFEFVKGSYLDIPISEFCTQVDFTDDCGRVLDTECNIDAELKLCFFTGAPRVTYVKNLNRKERTKPPQVPVIVDLDGAATLVDNTLDLIEEDPECLYDALENFFIVGTTPPQTSPSGDEFHVRGSGMFDKVLLNAILVPTGEYSGIGEIFPAPSIDYDLKHVFLPEGDISSRWLDKANGNFVDWNATNIIYPIFDSGNDLFVNEIGISNNSDIVNRYNTNPLSISPSESGYLFFDENDQPQVTGVLFHSIDEGVFIGGDYTVGDVRICDDVESFIQASSVNTEFDGSVKFEVTRPKSVPYDTRLRMRISGPVQNFESEISPKFYFSNVRFDDPSGNLIVKYQDFEFVGDSNQYNEDPGYTTYSLSPVINNATKYQWQDGYPSFDEPSGYTISFDVKSEDRGRPYGPLSAFTFGFEGDLDPQRGDELHDDFYAISGYNPTLRLSALEIYNSGRPVPFREMYLEMFALGEPIGKRFERIIKPIFFFENDFDTTIYPELSDLVSLSGWMWQDNTYQYSNRTCEGSSRLLDIIRNESSGSWITSNSAINYQDSGKLILKFGLADNDDYYLYDPGEFNGAFASIFNRWFDPVQKIYNREEREVKAQDSFFEFDRVVLRVLANKNSDARNYSLDLVGYSNDCILNSTSPTGGFLQNTSGEFVYNYATESLKEYYPQGNIPTFSGFNPIDDLGLSTEAISDKVQYYQTNLTNNAGADHYSVSNYPVVSGTEFRWYEIALEIYDDDVDLGRSRNYSLSSLLEELYIDLYALPSGANIAAIELAVRHRPAAAMEMRTAGGPNRRSQAGRSEISFYPVARSGNDNTFNTGSGYQPLSLIQDIPHAYASPTTVKTNYSRRWRGLYGIGLGAFDTRQFTYAYDRGRKLKRPLLGSFINWDDIEDSAPISVKLNSKFAWENKPAYFIEAGTPTSPQVFENYGARFKDQNMFSALKPGWSSDYRTADWTALTNGGLNYTSDSLYGKIYDGYDRVARFGNKTSAFYSNVNVASGAAIYARFIPDVNVSGEGQDNFFDFSSVASLDLAGSPSLTGLFIGYSGGYLFASGQNLSDHVVCTDTIPFSGYTYPLSLLVTYSENLDEKIRIYTDNENSEGEFTHLRATSDAIELLDTEEYLRFGYGQSLASGLPMLFSEFGFSHMINSVSGANIVSSNAVLNDKQITAERFFNNIRQKFWNPNESYHNDTNKFWSYVDENTAISPSADWYLGAFRACEFNWQYDSMNNQQVGKRYYNPDEDDQLHFYISHDGSAYAPDIPMPSAVNSGVAYHSQIENDFLRFPLSDTADNFYSTDKRIAKSLPRGYNFRESALVVDTVYEHKSSGNIQWGDCVDKSGPKLIVSLYTKNQEPYYTTDDPNWGLINRKSHFIAASSCVEMFQSTFTYDDYCDDSEEWALFPEERKLTEATEKYFSDDIDDMFVQIDLVYPSGPAFTSELDIHAIHVRTEEAWIKPTKVSGDLGVVMSGANLNKTALDLYTSGVLGIESGVLGFITSGMVPESGSGMLFCIMSGAYIENQSLGLITKNSKFISTDDDEFSGFGSMWNEFDYEPFIVGSSPVKGLQMFTVGRVPPVPVEDSGTLKFYMDGFGFEEEQLPLVVYNSEILPKSTENLNLSTFGNSAGTSGIRSNVSLYLLNDDQTFSNFGDTSGNINLTTFGVAQAFNNTPEAIMPLYIIAPLETSISAVMPLVIDNRAIPIAASADMGMFVRNNGVKGEANVPGDATFLWDGDNYGTGTDVDDEPFITLAPNDEIRGVDLFGYGSCDSNSPDKAIDPKFETDDVVWREEVCNDGGVFRPTNVYTNEEAGYENQYYGVRRYDDLKPNRPYFVEMRVKTGDPTPIPIPREFEEWEYGICGSGTLQNECCTPDCDQPLNYSGIKLIGDYPYLSGDISITPEFQIESGRQAGDRYGFSSCADGDLIAVGAPFHKVQDETGSLVDDAGAVFLYRRNEEENGKKANWYLEEKLLLPSGTRRDYIQQEIGTIVSYPPNLTIGGKKWAIGQEGRQFGHSVDIGNDGQKEVVVVGAPSAKWTRTFPEVVTSGIPVLMTIFTDKFSYNKEKLLQIRNVASKYDLLYKFFAAPWVVTPPDEKWQPKLDVRLLVCQLYDSDNIDDLPNVPSNKQGRGAAPAWFNHVYVNSLTDKQRENDDLLSEGLDLVKNKFAEIFPHNDSKIYSGIPPIVSFFGDDTLSTNNKAAYEDILDDFIDYYNEYSLASGVYDFIDDKASAGYVRKVFDDAFVWNEASVNLIQDTLDTGNLIATDNLRFITSGVGQQFARDDADDFQIPPESGGRVFVFEKEYGDWNCVQEFVSPLEDFTPLEDDDSYGSLLYEESNPVDRYGHSVGISENCEIISVGSPYSQEACQVFERDDTETTRMYQVMFDWLTETNDAVEYPLQHLIDRWNQLIFASGTVETAKQVYKEMTKKDRFLLRKNKNIKLYDKIYKHHYTDIQYTGTWNIIVNEFAGFSRLGYSTSVSEDGKTVAFGAPTDSFNEFDDMNVWYGGLTGTAYPENNTWASYVNAGAVRVFESRSFHNHNKAVEFYKFGNLDRSVNKQKIVDTGDVDAYEDLGNWYALDGVGFERTEFSDIEIPKDAGLAYIITPEIDAASDEIIDNIKTWLARGDRTLVLVGNDPVWKQGGMYKKSNDIINKILKKLGSRMRITAARNRFESLYAGISEEDLGDNKFNVTLAHLPQYMHESDAIRENMYASGVADIKIDLSDVGLEGLKIYSPCDPEDPDAPDRCIPPIQHSGDLRSEWHTGCFDKIEFFTNWAFHFDTANPGQNCKFYPEIVKPEVVKPDEEITPVLTAAEYIPQKDIIIPPRSGEEEKCTTRLSGIIKTTTTTETTIYNFGDPVGDAQFYILDKDDTAFGIYDNYERKFFENPAKENNRDALLRGTGIDWAGEATLQNVKVSDVSPYVTEETYTEEETSKVYLIASQLPENSWSMGTRFGDQFDPRNKDQNIAFYNNLTMIDCGNRARISQLGGWTGRESFKAAFDDSVVKTILENQGHIVNENIVYDNESVIPESVSVLWIASPTAVIPESYVAPIKNWMKLGNKKVVITYDTRQQIADNTAKTIDRLGFTTKPWLLDNLGSYYVQDTDELRNSALSSCCPVDPDTTPMVVYGGTNVIDGCVGGYSWTGSTITGSTKVDKLSAIPNTADPQTLNDSEVDPEGDGFNGYAYIPIKPGSNTATIVELKDPIFDKKWSTPDTYWKIDGESTMTFPVNSGSGYRLFVDWVSETDNEKFEVLFNLDDDNVVFTAGPPEDQEGQISPNSSKRLGKTKKYQPQRHFVDFRVKNDKEDITVTFNTNEWRQIKPEQFDGDRPYTPRILQVSGMYLPIESEVISKDRTIEKKIYITECSGVPWYIPGRTITVPPKFRPISTNHQKYCNPDAETCLEFDPTLDVEDGPMIVADELEHFSSFDTGLRRSRIVLITDSSMIQGFNSHYRYGPESPNVRLIRSLYPQSPDRSYYSQEDVSTSKKGTKFEFKQKLRSPENGSAAKYYANSGNQYLVEMYGLGGVAGNLNEYTDQEDNFALSDVKRRFTPFEKIKIDQEIERFGEEVVPDFGMYPRYSGNFYDQSLGEITHWVDSDIMGGIPRFMEVNDRDYLDIETIESGYPGDLFGYAIDLYKDKLIVGAPFNAYNSTGVVSWSGISAAYDAGDIGSGLKLSGRGGPGSAFFFSRTGRGTNATSEFLPWEFGQKIKPADSLQVGVDNATAAALTSAKGSHSLTDALASGFAWRPDMFGWSVSVESDFAAVGAPNHDYETLYDNIYYGNTAFVRKEFSKAFTIPGREYYDLGDPANRNNFPGSGEMILNNGAVFTFRHGVDNYQNRNKTWNFAEKLVAQGYNDRVAGSPPISGAENDMFGYSVCLNRANRGDSDYVMIVGAPYHIHPTSGNHTSIEISGAGSAYTYDAMLREQPDQIPVGGNYIIPRVYGDGSSLSGLFYQNISGPPITYSVSGLVNSTVGGHIFLEVSGYDPADIGFTTQRPYIESVFGEYISGTGINDDLGLFVVGKEAEASSIMPLFVYNSGEMIVGSTSYFWNSEDLENVNGSVGLFTSGIANQHSVLNFKTKGK